MSAGASGAGWGLPRKWQKVGLAAACWAPAVCQALPTPQYFILAETLTREDGPSLERGGTSPGGPTGQGQSWAWACPLDSKPGTPPGHLLPSTPEGCEHAGLSFPPCSGTGPAACSRAQPQGTCQPLSCPCLRIMPWPPGTRAPACHPRGAGTTPRPGESHGAGSLRQPEDGLGTETQRSRPERLPWAGGQAQPVAGRQWARQLRSLSLSVLLLSTFHSRGNK